jgi:hypothetical protein
MAFHDADSVAALLNGALGQLDKNPQTSFLLSRTATYFFQTINSNIAKATLIAATPDLASFVESI